MKTLLTAAVVAGSIVLLAGCYRYVPTEAGAVPGGGEVQVHLTREGMTAFGDGRSGLQEPTVRGTLIDTNDERLLLRVPVATRRDGFHTARLDQRVTVPAEHVVQVRRKELDRVKTGLLVTGGATAAGAALFLILEGSQLHTDDPRPEAPEARIPLFSVPVP